MRKPRPFILVLLVAAALWVVSPALAKSYSVTIDRPGSINGKQLATGDYKLELNGSGQAILLQHGKMVTETPVTVQRLAKGIDDDSVLYSQDGRILEIRTNHQDFIFTR